MSYSPTSDVEEENVVNEFENDSVDDINVDIAKNDDDIAKYDDDDDEKEDSNDNDRN